MKRLTVVLIVALAGVLLLGCGQPTSSSGSGSSAADEGAGRTTVPVPAETGSVPADETPARAPVAVVRVIGPQDADTPESLNGMAPLTVQLSGADSWDPDGYIQAYRWDFGDGETSEAANTAHTYGLPGRYTLTLSVVDDQGLSGQATVLIAADATAVPTEQP